MQDSLTVDSPLAISGSERLQVEDVNRRVFVPSVEHVINWCQRSKGRGKRRGEAQEKKKLTLSLPQPDKLPTVRNRMDACYFFLFSLISITFSLSFPSHSPPPTHTHTRMYFPSSYISKPPHSNHPSPLSLSLPPF